MKLENKTKINIKTVRFLDETELQKFKTETKIQENDDRKGGGAKAWINKKINEPSCENK